MHKYYLVTLYTFIMFLKVVSHFIMKIKKNHEIFRRSGLEIFQNISKFPWNFWIFRSEIFYPCLTSSPSSISSVYRASLIPIRGYFADLARTRGPQNTWWPVRRSASPQVRRLPVAIIQRKSQKTYLVNPDVTPFVSVMTVLQVLHFADHFLCHYSL